MPEVPIHTLGYVTDLPSSSGEGNIRTPPRNTMHASECAIIDGLKDTFRILWWAALELVAATSHGWVQSAPGLSHGERVLIAVVAVPSYLSGGCAEEHPG